MDGGAASCTFCACQCETWRHMWWECECFASQRPPEFSLLQPDLLPTALVNAGIAPAVWICPGKPFWASDPGAEVPEGVPVWAQPPEEIEAFLREQSEKVGHSLERGVPLWKLAQLAQGTLVSERIPVPREVQGRPPEEPDTFTD
eukprot:2684614-Alexandrium_andersonii.AAC.1